ncbi:hypothetical protein [Geotalea toluenoxydans]|uniref:hypothetical protein n=1 Tax=Geotalea toluenoxydans TaxID=421624 RepID=UPI0034E20BD2
MNGYCQLLMELCRNILEPKYMGYLQEINNGVLRMNRLIDSFSIFRSYHGLNCTGKR